jgi:malate dehydrogenase (oxaloacetate-decarboxylating)(NADP+)
MADKPIILALANPEPEIRPELAKAARPDCIIATGRSDYPNQVNNVLCFPYIFRGALDCGATKITEAMKLACVREIAALAKAETSDEVAAAYAGQELSFGPDYIIPKPFDARLILRIAPAVARPRPSRAWPRGRSPTWTPTASADALRLPDRHGHAPGVRRRQGAGPRSRARGLCRRRGRARAARRAGGAGRGPGPAHPGGPARGGEDAHRARRPAPGSRARLRAVDPENDPRFRDYWEPTAA